MPVSLPRNNQTRGTCPHAWGWGLGIRSYRHLDRQLGRLAAFAGEQRWTVVAALTDVVSGLHENRRGLHQPLNLAQERRASLVVVEYRDRLARFGLGYLEPFLHAFGVRIVVMESPVKDDQQKLVEDLIAITTSFSARIYGQGGGKTMGATVRRAEPR